MIAAIAFAGLLVAIALWFVGLQLCSIAQEQERIADALEQLAAPPAPELQAVNPVERAHAQVKLANGDYWTGA